jgi:YfiH family protein
MCHSEKAARMTPNTYLRCMGVPLLQLPGISTPHGFTTRHGGVSIGEFSSLNLGGTLDNQEFIEENRNRVAATFGLNSNRFARLNQIHSDIVVSAKPGTQEGDALVTLEPGLLLAVGAADCYPILFHDPINNVIGAAHCGWKGTIAHLARKTVEAMRKLGASASDIQVAIGPGISGTKYEVSTELIDQFRMQGFPEHCFNGRLLNLLAANVFVLEQAGIDTKNIHCINRCTTETEFFSHRRDQGKTGRMWGVILLK